MLKRMSTIVVPIVQSAIVNNQAKVVTEFAELMVFPTVQFVLHFQQVHGSGKRFKRLHFAVGFG